MAFDQTKADLFGALARLEDAKRNAKRERIRKDDQQEFFSLTVSKTIDNQISILTDLVDLLKKKFI